MTTLLIDGDILAYAACSGVEESTHWGDDFWTLIADARQAKQMVDAQIALYKRTLGATDVIVAFSDPNENWRWGVLSSYKGNRLGKRKPVCWPEVREYTIKVYSGQVYPRLEADDVLGILATSPTRLGRKIIVSEDKDLKQIPGLLYNPNKAEEGVQEITEEAADRWHLFQTLTGDAVDNYKGCPGCGPVKAEKLLDASAKWPTVVAAYEKAGLSEEEALRQARVARILRSDDYTRKGEITLWNP